MAWHGIAKATVGLVSEELSAHESFSLSPLYTIPHQAIPISFAHSLRPYSLPCRILSSDKECLES